MLKGVCPFPFRCPLPFYYKSDLSLQDLL